MLRRATAEDIPAIAVLVQAAYAPWVAVIGRRPGPMDDDHAARVARGETRVLVDGGTILALIVSERHGDHLLLDTIAVSPEAQGRGFGRRLLAEAEREAREAGLARLRLYTHALMASNIALYRRAGFELVARVTEKGFDRVYMEKPLTPPP